MECELKRVPLKGLRMTARAAYIALVAILECGCVEYVYNESPPGAAVGHVLDEQGRPIEGAIVAFDWVEHFADIGMRSGSDCRFARTLMTDASGGYLVPTYRGHFPTTTRVYKRGSHQLHRSTSDIQQEVYRLGFSDGIDDRRRIKEIWENLRGVGCGIAEIEDPSMKVFWQEIADELRHLPSSKERDELLRLVEKSLTQYK